jgi:hypothetical protein
MTSTLRLAAMLLLIVGLIAGSAVRGFRDYRTWYAEPELVNLHVRQAAAWLKGSVALQGGGIDAAIVDGRTYDPFPPGPALLFVLPVALVGERLFVAPIICLLLSVLNGFTLRTILRRLNTRADSAWWLMAAFFLGSGYWFTAAYSYGVWHSAHVTAVAFVLLAIYEALGRGRGWVIGACLGMAFLSRQFTLLNAPFVLALAASDSADAERRLRWRNLMGLCVALAACVGLYLVFNVVRFGNPWDTGYGHLDWQGYERARVEQYGVFSLAYLPVNLYHLLVPGFHLEFSSPDRMSGPMVDWFGTSLLAASPFLLVAFLTRAPKIIVTTAWGSILAIALAQGCYFVNGAGQLNWQRYALDYWPVLFVLIAIGFDQQVRQHRGQAWKMLIAYAIGINAFVLVFFNWFAVLLDRWPQWLAER